jgi:UDP-2,3-diacylglucosamine pyrophosphatase LpxH
MARNVDVVVISDTHLGTYGCQAKELFTYLKSVSPKTLIINGDFIDIWQFSKSYFPKYHLKVIKKIIDLASKGTEVVYILGNHDEFLRRFADTSFGNIELTNKKIMTLDGKKAWFFHGDVFDASVQHSKWIAKLGGIGYDFLIRLNVISNWILTRLGREKYSFSKKIKNLHYLNFIPRIFIHSYKMFISNFTCFPFIFFFKNFSLNNKDFFSYSNNF